MADLHARGRVEREFARHAVRVDARPSEATRSGLYLEVLPLLTAGRVRLLDNARLVAQFCNLERRALPGGREAVDHPRGAGNFDDLCNSAAGALWRATANPPMTIKPGAADEIRTHLLQARWRHPEAVYGERAWAQRMRRRYG
jgi:hypothetical protein